MRLRSGLAAVGGVLLALLPAASALAQCAMCRATLESSPEALAKGGELNQAILLLFVAPYVVTSTLALALFRRRIASSLRPRLAAALASFRHPR